MMWRVALLSIALGSCHPSLSAQSVPQPSASGPSLETTIDQLLDVPELARGTWGIAIRSLDHGDALYERNPGKLMLPASTLKVLTLAVSAERLGWDYTYTTALYRTGEIVDGVLQGDLIVVGSGDPSFDDWDGAASAQFSEWAARLKADGIREVAGRVIGDDNAFDDDELGNGWMWDDVAAGYSAKISGLQFNENTAQLLLSPTAAPGASVTVDARPPWAPLSVTNRATVAPAGRPLEVRPLPTSGSLEIVGTLPPASAPVVRNVAVANPTLYFARAAREAFIANGVPIAGPAVDVDDTAPVVMTKAVVVADHQSAALAELGKTMMRLSQNLFAESLLKTLDHEATGAPGTAVGGRAIVAEQLAAWEMAPQDVAIVDGSGLSRYDLITPSAQVAILSRVYNRPPLREPFMATLPIAGAPGPLERRMIGTPAQGNARAKTGSFANARGLTGFVRSADGEMLAFSILANNYNAPSSLVDRTVDAIVAALAGFSRPRG